MWFTRKKCCCEELRKELKKRFDTVDYGMVRILNRLNEIERQELSLLNTKMTMTSGAPSNPYQQMPWRIEVPNE